jgi:hypothetical protein
MVAGRAVLKYIYFIKFVARGQDAVSINHHCANTNVVGHITDKMDRDYIDDFFIQADSGQLYFKIDKVFGFPINTCTWGGYDTQSRIEIKSGNYLVKGQVYISTGNIYNFFRQDCYKTLKGTATLDSVY